MRRGTTLFFVFPLPHFSLRETVFLIFSPIVLIFKHLAAFLRLFFYLFDFQSINILGVDFFLKFFF